MNQWLYIHFPQLPLEQARRQRHAETQSLTTSPADTHETTVGEVVLSEQEQTVLVASDSASAAGIRPGCTLPQAHSLMPDLQVYMHDPAGVEWGLQQRALTAYQQVGRVALSPPLGLILEIGSMNRLVPSGAELQASLVAALQALETPEPAVVWASQGHSPLMARLLAEVGGQPAESTPAARWQACETLPLSACGLPEHTLPALRKMGLRNCGDVLSLSPTALGRRFGPSIQQWQARLLGEVPETYHWFHPPRRFQRRLTLEEDVAHQNGLQFPLRVILEEFEQFCRQTQQCTDELRLRLWHRERQPTELLLGSARPEHRAAAWLGLLRLRLDQLTLFEPVHSVWLMARRLMALNPTRLTLSEQEQASRDPLQLLSRLQARLGEQRLMFCEHQADYRPEKQSRESPVRPAASGMNRSVANAPPPRPAWLLAVPQAIGRDQFSIVHFTERIQSGWWDLQGVRRDYYQARLNDHRLAWVYQRADGQWYLAGYFG